MKRIGIDFRMDRIMRSLLTMIVLMTVVGTAWATPSTKPGVDGVFGQTYRLKSGFDYTVLSAEYSVTRVNAFDCTVPTADEKVVLLHVRIKNAAADDNYFDSSAHGWSAIDEDGHGHAGGTDYGRTSTGKGMVQTIKRGQGYDDAFTSILVPSKGTVTKLVLGSGRANTDEQEIRFNIGSGKNVIAALPEYATDPSDSTGSTALTDIDGKIGAFYPMGTFDVRFDKLEFSDGPVDGNNADAGKRFMIVTVTFRYLGNNDDSAIYPSLFDTKTTNADGDDLEFDGGMIADRDEDVPGDHRVKWGEQYSIRFYGQLPKSMALKSFTISEGGSRRYVFGVTDQTTAPHD